MKISVEVEINEVSCEGCDFGESEYNNGFCHLFRDHLFIDKGNDELTPHPDCMAAREQTKNNER